MDVLSLQERAERVDNVEAIFQNQFVKVFGSYGKDELLELGKLMPRPLLNKLDEIFFKNFSTTRRVGRQFLPSAFGLLLMGLNDLAVKEVGHLGEEFFSNKLLGPFDELSAKYQVIIQLYKDGFVELFPKRHRKKLPTMDQFIDELGTDDWIQVRFKLGWSKEETEKMGKRINLMTRLMKLLQIANKDQKKFKENPSKFILDSMDEVYKRKKKFQKAVEEDKRLAREYERKKGFTSDNDGVYVVGKGARGLQALQKEREWEERWGDAGSSVSDFLYEFKQERMDRDAMAGSSGLFDSSDSDSW
jgi:hypothetical protein